MPPTLEIRSGGQTGVDRAALDVARTLGIPTAGWCPHGGWAEDFPEPPGLLAAYPMLTPTPSHDPRQRTAWNVRDSDATLILTPRGDAADSPGADLTRAFAELVFLKPYIVVDVGRHDADAGVAAWIHARMNGSARLVRLNVAGPRESESPGVYARASELLARTLRRLG
jgi:putative molybdenum carrier protein